MKLQILFCDELPTKQFYECDGTLMTTNKRVVQIDLTTPQIRKFLSKRHNINNEEQINEAIYAISLIPEIK